ncbi:Fc receptor-like protein 5 isoform X3 [Brienomyrus brachyistius]|uniref:Fc receptor-like protein 5 isoform X3 n=1 Tax=Brienomyrus brachyistius TaxID=42636 RepID=UPI0020B34AEB|nr:Fc receptor-like protein 5 isoform X3 [Brienomyrus brachyistius]
MDTLPHRLLLLALVSACAGQEVPLDTELAVTIEISFLPSDKIIEGDSLEVHCRVRRPLPPGLKVLVMKGPTILKSGSKKAFWNTSLARAADGGNYTCKAEANGIQKSVSRSVHVAELTITPEISFLPSDKIIEGDSLEVHCRVRRPLPPGLKVLVMKGPTILNSGSQEAFWNTSLARAADAGTYMCKAEANGIQKSVSRSVHVAELFSMPVLTVQPADVFEGQMLTFSCKSAHIDSQRINANDVKYHLYKDDIKVADLPSGEYRMFADLRFNGNYSCQAKAKSVQKWSSAFVLKTKELTITPEISFLPSDKIIEGDSLEVHCRVRRPLPPGLKVLVMRGPTILNSGSQEAFWNTSLAQAADAGTYMCKAEANDIQKSVSRSVHVAELFSKPVLSMPPPDVFEGQMLTFSCKSAHIDSQRINANDVKYHLYKDNVKVADLPSGEYRITADVHHDGNYSCQAEAKSVQKQSLAFVLKTKELTITPEISFLPSDKIIEGDSLEVHCRVRRPPPPGLKVLVMRGPTILNSGSQEAFWNTNLAQAADAGTYMCKAEANDIQKSVSRSVHVAELFSMPVLTVQPADVFEGQMLTFSCKSAHIDSQRINANDVKYHLYKDNMKVADLPSGEYRVTADVHHDGNYSCQAEAKSVQKRSSAFVLKIKVFTINKVTLTILPATEVQRDTDVELKCDCAANVSKMATLTYQYSFYKYEQLIHAENHSFSHLSHRLHAVRVPTSGLYSCEVKILTASKRSEAEFLRVTGVETPSLKVSSGEIFEGEELSVECRAPKEEGPFSFSFYYNATLFHTNSSKENFLSTKLKFEQAGKYEVHCNYKLMLFQATSEKSNREAVTVRELFSKPVLSMPPPDVFEGQMLTFSCKSAHIDSQRINANDVKYHLYKDNVKVEDLPSGEYRITADVHHDGNYSCQAEAKSVRKQSLAFVLKTKVLVSEPLIEAWGNVILGRPFSIVCQSVRGSLPITYTLLFKGNAVSSFIVHSPQDRAIFNITSMTINSREEIRDFKCFAQNFGDKSKRPSLALNTTVTEPVSDPQLTAMTSTGNVVEGKELILFCTVKDGSPPFTFEWYHNGEIINSSTTDERKHSYTLSKIEHKQGGRYYCQVQNNETESRRSEEITVTVKNAPWKTAVTGSTIVLLLSIITFSLIYCIDKKARHRSLNQTSL